LLGYVILTINEMINKKNTPNLELGSGYYLIIWLAGLTLLSYLGSYPKLSEGKGNLGVLPVGWDIVILAVFSILIMWLAVANRLQVGKVKENIKGPMIDVRESERETDAKQE